MIASCLASCEKDAGQFKEQASGPGPTLVQTSSVRDGQLLDEWPFLGNVRPLSRASLAAGAAGAVSYLQVREGQAVSKGALLLEVDPVLAAAGVSVAQANEAQGAEQLAQAERELSRFEQLSDRVISAQELDQARSRVGTLRAQLQGLRAQVAEAQATRERHRVRAPFDGVIAARRVDPGDWLQPGQVVLEIVSTGAVEVLVDVHPELFGKVKVGDAARLGAANLAAQVQGIVPALDPTARTMRVRLRANNADNHLLPGAAVMVTFSVDFSGQGVVVPRDALLREPNEVRVIRVEDGKAVALSVEVLASSPNDVLVLAEALKIGDQVVIRGNERLRTGQPVEIAEQ